MATAERSIGALTQRQSRLWVLALLTFGVGDVVTTWLGLRISGVVEVGPVTTPIVQRYGIAAILGLKGLVFAGGFLAWRLLPPPHRVGIPLGVAVVGVAVTCWNAVVLLAATA